MNIFIPKSYSELSPAQARWMFKIIADHPELNSVEFKAIAFLRFAKIQVITKDHESGDFIVKINKTIFRISAEEIAAATANLDWMLFPPRRPWRPDSMAWGKPTLADFSKINFESYITIDNLYQGYLATENIMLLKQIAQLLVPRHFRPFRRHELIAVFYWVASVKDFFAKKFKHFFQSVAQDNSLASDSPTLSAARLEEAMNAQIRALTKGDIARESEILAMPCWRALVELDAQAREYIELNAKMNKS